jgi:NAD(P)H-hydrate epimerase
MIPVLTVSQMRAVDKETIGGDVAVGYSLMVKAGTGIADVAKKYLLNNMDKEIAIFCGKGNNGGDGYVAGKILLDEGCKVMCYSLCPIDELKGECKIAFNEYSAKIGNVMVLDDIADIGELSKTGLIIDAMLGTGLKGDPHGLYALTIDAINKAAVPVIAIDTPSGLDNDTAIPGKPCINASITVTMGFPKIGLLFYPGKQYVGELIIEDLGYSEKVVNQYKDDLYYSDGRTMAQFLPPRKPYGSKIDHGLALLICGSRGMAGSAALASEAALRTGCGMTHLAIPESLMNILSIKLTETVLHPLYETSQGTSAVSAFEQIAGLSRKMHAICIGPGLSHENSTSQLVRKLIKEIKLPAVLDADGLNAFRGMTQDLKGHAGELLITPHRGEWVRLFGDLSAEPVEAVRQMKHVAKEFGITILLKGSPTIVVCQDGASFILPFGNSALATAGTGDVLSGIIVSLIAQGASVKESALLGVYIQGNAGMIASEKFGEHSVIASDVVSMIYKVICNLAGK